MTRQSRHSMTSDSASYLSATSMAYGLEVLPPQSTEHDILSVFFAGKTKKGYGTCNSIDYVWRWGMKKKILEQGN